MLDTLVNDYSGRMKKIYKEKIVKNKKIEEEVEEAGEDEEEEKEEEKGEVGISRSTSSTNRVSSE